MKLSLTDIHYIDARLDEHELKYQEVYNEIRDHVLLAIEAARANGDGRKVEHIYNDMMEAQFPGYYPFARISIAYEAAYRAKINKMVWANVRHYLNPLNLVLLALAVVVGYYYLPANNITYILLSITLITISVSPVIYVRFKSTGLKPGSGKRSIIRQYILNRAIVCLNFFLIPISLEFFLHDGWSAIFTAGGQQPKVNLFIMAFGIIYGLSIARLCRQEIKSPDLNINQQ